MKIAYFTNNYLPYVSGVGSSIEGSRLELEKRGHQVYVLAPFFKEDAKKIVDGDRIIRYPSIQTNFKAKFPVAIIPAPKITRILKQINPDVFHAHHPFWLGAEALKYARKFRKPLVFTAHTKFEHYVHYIPFFPAKIMAKLLLRKRTRFSNNCKAVIAPTEGIKKELIDENVKSPIHVIPSGINTDKFKNAEGARVREKLGILANEKVLLFLGRLGKEKNLDLLLKTIPQILNKYPLTKFLAVGEGEEKIKFSKLKKQYPQRVILTGKVLYKEVPDYYKAADIFLQPSLSETQGLTTVEAMVSGLAVVSVDSEAIDNFIENRKSGLIVPADENSFLEAVCNLLDDDNLTLELQNNAVKLSNRIDIKNCTNKLLEVYNKVIVNMPA